MKYYASLFIAVFLFSASFTHSAHADNHANAIAVVNIQKIIATSAAAKDVKKQIESKRETYQNAINKEEEKLREQDKELAGQRSLLSAEAYKEKVEEFKKKVAAIQQDVQEKRGQMDRAYAKSLSRIQQISVDVITEICKAKGFSLAVPSNGVLFAETELDISDEVLKEVNKRLPKLTVVFEEDEKATNKTDS